MRLRTLVALLLLPFAVVTAVERVSLSQLQSEWAKYQNQIVEITRTGTLALTKCVDG